ncbi:excalibur calcium-binding domain-containing protein, partial [Paenarthrobacter nitroguajacolicus]
PVAPAPVAPAPAYYANCAAARAAGAAPLYAGQPGYRAGLDRDNDGVACE